MTRTTGIYVETSIRGSMDDLWRRTRTPDLHVRWDLRFTDIRYLPRPDDALPQRFLYTTRIGLGLAIAGEGETVGQHDDAEGQRVSSLRFWSDDPKSLIREGSGYWRYVPTPDGLRFLTAYDYRVRFGVAGRVFDAVVFRPLIGWATAWSFDRLRLWIEKGIEPAVSLERSLIHMAARAAVAFAWIYQGAVPKLLVGSADELVMIESCGVSPASAPRLMHAFGWAEVLFGITMLLSFHRRTHLVLTIVLMLGATIGVAIGSPRFLGTAFNAVVLNLLMIALAVVGLLANRDLPRASRCRRVPTECHR